MEFGEMLKLNALEWLGFLSIAFTFLYLAIVRKKE